MMEGMALKPSPTPPPGSKEVWNSQALQHKVKKKKVFKIPSKYITCPIRSQEGLESLALPPTTGQKAHGSAQLCGGFASVAAGTA